VDAIVTIWADRNTRALSRADPDRVSKKIASRRQLTNRFWERIDEGKAKWVGTRFPTEAHAQDAEMSLLEYEDFDVCTLLLSEVPADHIRAKVDDLLAPIRSNAGLYEALVEYFARDMDVTATAEAMHVHPNTLRYRLARIEKLLGRSLRQPATIAELTLALMAAPHQM